MDIRAPDRRPEQTRARYPDEAAYVERDGVKNLLRGLRRRRADSAADADVGKRSLAVLEVPNPLPG